MLLKSPQKKMIEILYDDLCKRVKDHESGKSELFIEAYRDYKHDIKVLKHLLFANDTYIYDLVYHATMKTTGSHETAIAIATQVDILFL